MSVCVAKILWQVQNHADEQELIQQFSALGVENSGKITYKKGSNSKPQVSNTNKNLNNVFTQK